MAQTNFGLYTSGPSCDGFRGIPHRGLLRHSWVTNPDGSRNATRESYNYTTTLRPAFNGRCPESHPEFIPGSAGCCAESPATVGGRPTYERIPDRTANGVKRGGATGLDGHEGKRGRDEDDDNDAMTDFGKSKKSKTRSFQSFRKAYKKNHPGVSDHAVLVKYLAGLVRLRNMY